MASRSAGAKWLVSSSTTFRHVAADDIAVGEDAGLQHEGEVGLRPAPIPSLPGRMFGTPFS
jgi:hypothetical protein